MRTLETIFATTILPLLPLLGWALLHFLWQGALVAALLAASRALLLRERSAKVRYTVACGALTLMLLLPLLTMWTLYEADATGELPSTQRTMPATATARAAQLNDESRMHNSAIVVAVATLREAGRGRVYESVEPVLPWLVAIWLTCVLLLSARLAGGAVRAQRLKRRGTRAVPAEWEESLASLAARLRVSRPVRLLESSLVQAPAAIGWLRPVILLPASVLTGLTPGQLETILAHELAHIRRHDYLFNLLQTVVETLLFYHPAVWWVSRQVRVEREHACDDLAVEVCGDALVYARALTRLERLRGQSAPRLAVAADGGDLLARIRRLVEPPAPTSNRFAAPLAGLLIIITTVVAIGATGTRVSQFSTSSSRFSTSSPSSASNAQERTRNDSQQRGATSDEARDKQAEFTRRLSAADATERAKAACALGHLRAVAAIPALVRTLSDETRVEPLRCWDSNDWSPALQVFKQSSPGEEAAIALASLGEPSVAPLVAVLKDADAATRRNAAWAIGEIRGGASVERAQAVAPLIDALTDTDEWVRRAAAFGLSELKDERAALALISALDDVSARVREMSAVALGEMRARRAVEKLSAVLQADAAPDVRAKAAWALGEIKDASAVSPLRNALRDEDERVREEVKTALSEFEDY